MIIQIIQFMGAIGFGICLLGWFLAKGDENVKWLIAMALFMLVAK